MKRSKMTWLGSLALASSLVASSVHFSLASATVLILDANGNYVDARTLKSGATPYAAPDASAQIEVDPSQNLPEEGAPFPDPNAAVATDAARMENPASNYEIILRETEALAKRGEPSEAANVALDRPELDSGAGVDLTSPDFDFTLREAPDLQAAETGGLVFAAIVEPEEKGSSNKPLNETGLDSVVHLQAMPALDSIQTPIADTSIFAGPTEYDAIIRKEVAKFDNVDFPFVKAVIAAESNYNLTAVSPKGAMGLMQLMPATAELYGVVNPFSPEENIRAGTAELSRLMTLYRNPTLALAGYNAGQGAVTEHNGVPPFRETQEYIVRVLTKTFAAREQLVAHNKAEEKTDEPEVDPRSRPLSVQTFDW